MTLVEISEISFRNVGIDTRKNERHTGNTVGLAKLLIDADQKITKVQGLSISHF